MRQTTSSRKAIFIPHSVDVMSLDELASRLASAIHASDGGTQPKGGTSDAESDAVWYVHQKAADIFRKGLMQACEIGQLVARDPVAHMQCPPGTKGAMLLVDDAMHYLAESGASVRITRTPETIAFVGLHPDALVPLDDIPLLVATAMHDPETDSEWHGLQRVVTEKSIYDATSLGMLAMCDARTRQPLSVRTSSACVTASDLCKFFEGARKKEDAPAPVTRPEPVTWNGYTYQPPPPLTEDEVETARVEVEAMQAAEERRQAREQEAEREHAQRNWWSVSSGYIVSVMHEHQCTTAKNLFYKLEELAGESSPFKRGKGANLGALVVKELAQTVSLKTFQNRWKEIKEAALG